MEITIISVNVPRMTFSQNGHSRERHPGILPLSLNRFLPEPKSVPDNPSKNAKEIGIIVFCIFNLSCISKFFSLKLV